MRLWGKRLIALSMMQTSWRLLYREHYRICLSVPCEAWAEKLFSEARSKSVQTALRRFLLKRESKIGEGWRDETIRYLRWQRDLARHLERSARSLARFLFAKSACTRKFHAADRRRLPSTRVPALAHSHSLSLSFSLLFAFVERLAYADWLSSSRITARLREIFDASFRVASESHRGSGHVESSPWTSRTRVEHRVPILRRFFARKHRDAAASREICAWLPN